MTVYEDRQDTPMMGAAVMQELTKAWENPTMLRAMLPPRLRRRFDYWCAQFGFAEQLDFFGEDT